MSEPRYKTRPAKSFEERFWAKVELAGRTLEPVHTGTRGQAVCAVSHRVLVRGRWYWFSLSLRHGFVEFGHRRLVWHIFTVPRDPLRREQP